MTKKHIFTATIQNAGGGGAFVEIPFDVEKGFGSKRPKVKAMIEGVCISRHAGSDGQRTSHAPHLKRNPRTDWQNIWR